MKTKKEYIVYGLILIMISGVTASLTGLLYKINKVSTNFESINLGDKERMVINKLGKPQQVRECTENLWFNEQFISKNKGICNKEFKYSYLGDLEFWTVGFDEQGKVVSKYHGGSP